MADSEFDTSKRDVESDPTADREALSERIMTV
jgi:hypothetical protein